MKNISKAIIAVMKEVKGMEKNSRVGNGSHAYNGTKDQDVKEVFNDALANNGLCILPIGVQDETTVSRWVDSYGKNKQSIFCSVKTKYMLLHTSGESIELAGYGHGVDPQDKAAGKATTYALKNCLLYTFLTPVGKIDDTDTTHSNDIDTPDERKEVKDDQLKDLVSWAIKKEATIKDVESIYKLTPTQKATVSKGIKASK